MRSFLSLRVKYADNICIQRDFSAITIFGFTMVLIASWEAVLA